MTFGPRVCVISAVREKEKPKIPDLASIAQQPRGFKVFIRKLRMQQVTFLIEVKNSDFSAGEFLKQRVV